MLQSDIGENGNDGFIDTTTPITPAAGSSRQRKTRRKWVSKGVPTERSGGRFISYLRFLSGYWNHLPQLVTRNLGACTTCLVCSISNRRVRPRFGFWRDSGGYQRFRKNHRHAAQVFGSRYLLIQWSSRNVLLCEGGCIRSFHRIHQAKAKAPGVRCGGSVSST
jgi:hypothetical protein